MKGEYKVSIRTHSFTGRKKEISRASFLRMCLRHNLMMNAEKYLKKHFLRVIIML